MATYVTSTSALSSSTTTSASLQDKLTLTLTAAQQEASAVYFVIAYAEVAASVAGNRINLKLVNTTGSVTYQDLAPAPALSTYNDNLGQMMVGVFTAAGTPVDNTFKIQYSSDTGNEVRIQNVTLLILKKGSEDQYDETTGKYDATTGYVAIASKTFTPGSSGDYLVIGCCEALASANARPATRITIASSLVTGMVDASDTPTASARHALSLSWFVNLAASSQTITFDLKGDDTTADIYNRRLLVIRLSDLPAYWSNTNSTLDSTLPTSFEAKVTLTETLPAVPVWAIATVPGRTSSTATVSIITTLRTGGTERVSGTTRPRALFGNECTDTMTLAYLFTGSGSSTTVDAGWYSASSISGNIQYASLVVLQLESGGISGVLTKTEASDTVSSAGTVTLAAALAKTEASDTLGATGTIALAATASIAEDADTIAATGALAAEISGEVSIAEAADTVAATGAVLISSTASIAETSDAIVASAVVGLAGTAAIAEDSDSVSAATTLAISADGSISESSDTVSSAGTLAIVASASIIESSDTVSSVSALAIVADLEISEAADTASAAAAVTIRADASIAEADDAVSATGVFGTVIAGTASITESADTCTATGTVALAATVSIAEASDTVSGTATILIAADAALIEDADASTSIGSIAISGTSAISEASDTISASGTQLVVTALDFDVSTVLWTFGRRTIAMGPNYTADMGPRYTARRT